MTHPLQRASDASPLPARPFRFFLYVIRHFVWGIAAMVIFEAGQAVCQILIPYVVKDLMDQAPQITGVTLGDIFLEMKAPITFFLVISLGILLFSRASGSILVLIGPSMRRFVRRNLYRYLQYHSQRFFLGNFAGTLANRIAEVSMSVNHATWSVILDFWPIVVSFSITLFLLFRESSALGFFVALWISIYLSVCFILAMKCRIYSKSFAAARSTVSGKIVDAVSNILNSKMFAQLGFERQYLEGYLETEVKAARKVLWFMEKMRWFQFIASLILQIGLVLYALSIWRQGAITVGAFAMVTSLSLMMISDARGLSRRFLEFFEYIGNITDGVSAIVQPHEVIDLPDAKTLRISAGEIAFRNVDFCYTQGNPVFKKLNVTIHPGERVGLVGFSGSGKSTFVNLILRLYESATGEILIDGQNIRNITQDSLRAQISMIPQDPMLFHRTLMENIRYGKLDATDEEVIEAAKKANAHEFISIMAEKYDAMVGERGVKLSGGQRQRIAIARAILKGAPILLMDEATSSLDSVTEKAIQASLETLMKGRSVIVIAHRLSTIAHLDRILVFEKGEIIEDANHDTLIAQNGAYARLWRMQSGGFLPTASPSDHSN